MKKQHLFIVSGIILTGLAFGTYQYFQAFKTENALAVTVGTFNPGHPWVQMECNGDTLCIDSTNKKVGVGTNNPTEKLTVAGNIKSTDICTDSGCLNALFQTVNTTVNQELYGHSTTGRHILDCNAIGGNTTIVAAGVAICQVTGSSCPSNWSQYLNWSTTTSNNSSLVACCSGGSCPALDCANRVYCSTGSHTWANTAVETCQASSACGLGCSGQASATATRTQIGCY